MHFADRLTSMQEKGQLVCVGIDPRWEQCRWRSQSAFARHAGRDGDRVRRIQHGVLEIVAPHGDRQAAERVLRARRGGHGVPAESAFEGTLSAGHNLDSKRGDIASTAEAHADVAPRGQAVFWDGRRAGVERRRAHRQSRFGRDSPRAVLAKRAGLRRRRLHPGAPATRERSSFRICNATASLSISMSRRRSAIGRRSISALAVWAMSSQVVGATHPQELSMVRHGFRRLVSCRAMAHRAAAADTAAAFRPTRRAIVNSRAASRRASPEEIKCGK